MPLALQGKPGSSLDVAVTGRLKERILPGTNARLSVAFLADGRIKRIKMLTLYYSRIDSPVGPLLLAMSDCGLAILAFGHELPDRLGGEKIDWQESDEACATVRQQLEEYFAGRRREFTVLLDLRGTDFQKDCWEELLRIPYGETRSYAEVAKAVGRPTAYRAVGQSNHRNPVAIIIPCHRVLAGGRALGGYGGGLLTKGFLLRLEGAKFRDDSAMERQQPALAFS